ncbi:42097_t:CDS:2, partial [Gigaspora margarita]
MSRRGENRSIRSQTLKFTLHGRVLSIVKAIDRDEAHRLTEENKNKKQRENRRNIYLNNVLKTKSFSYPYLITCFIVIFPNTPDALLQKLSVRNLPLFVMKKEFKNLGKESIKKFKKEVKNGKRADLSKVKKLEEWDKLVHINRDNNIRKYNKVDGNNSNNIEVTNLNSNSYLKKAEMIVK